MKGAVHTGFVEELLKTEQKLPDTQNIKTALVAGAIDRYYRLYRADFYNFKQQLSRIGSPRNLPENQGYEINLSAAGNSYTILVNALGENYYQLIINDTLITCKYQHNNNEGTLYEEDKRYNILMIERGDALQCEVNGFPVLLESDSGGWIKSPSPAIVLSVNCSPEQSVSKGDLLITLEAMKMEMLVEAPADGTVKEISVIAGGQVSAGSPLLRMEEGNQTEETAETEIPASPAVEFAESVMNSAQYWESLKRELFAVFLGYDHRKKRLTLLKEINSFVEKNPEFRVELIEAFIKALEIHSIIETLFLSREIKTANSARPVSNQELLTHYFRRDTDKEKGLPGIFIENLKKAIGCYSVPGLSEDEKQNHALFHIFKSHAELQEKDEMIKQILFSLEGLGIALKYHKLLSGAIDNIISVSQTRAPSVVDAAVHLSYEVIEKYYFRQLHKAQNKTVEKLINDILDRDERNIDQFAFMPEIIDSSGAIVSKLVNMALNNGNKQKEIALEALGRRFNRDREIITQKIIEIDGIPYCTICGKEFVSITTVIQAENFTSLPDITEITGPDGRPAEIIILLQNFKAENDNCIEELLKGIPVKAAAAVKFLSIGITGKDSTHTFRTYKAGDTWREIKLKRDFSPLEYRELKIYRLTGFDTNILTPAFSSGIYNIAFQSEVFGLFCKPYTVIF